MKKMMSILVWGAFFCGAHASTPAIDTSIGDLIRSVTLSQKESLQKLPPYLAGAVEQICMEIKQQNPQMSVDAICEIVKKMEKSLASLQEVVEVEDKHHRIKTWTFICTDVFFITIFVLFIIGLLIYLDLFKDIAVLYEKHLKRNREYV